MSNYSWGVDVSKLPGAGSIFSQRATFLRQVRVQDPNSAEVVGAWVPVEGLEDIPCMLSPLVDQRPQGNDLVKEGKRRVITDFRLTLNGLYQGILPEFVVEVEGDRYAVVGPENSYKTLSRARVRRVQ